MRPKLISATCLFWIWVAASLFGVTPTKAADMKLEAQLVWGTTSAVSPNPKHKPVEPDVEKKLKKLPFKWEHYFEVSRKRFTVPEGEEKEVEMSQDCSIKVKNAGDSKVQVNLYGKGKLVGKIGQGLPKGDMLVLGGNAPDSTGWLVVLKRLD